MKKVKKSIHTYGLTAKLFFDDLEEIDKILKESWSSYTLTIDEYELSSINEITQIEEKQDFNELKIMLTEPSFYLSIDEYSTSIYCDDNSLCIGVSERIKPIIRKRRKTYFNFFIEAWAFIFNFLLILLNFLDIYYDLYSDFIDYIITGTIFLLSLKIIISIFRNNSRYKRNKFTVFTTKKSKEQSNYYTRNKDQIITSLISGFIGLVTGICVAWYRFQLTCQ